MRYSEKWGDSIDAAVELALQELKLTKDQVTVTVLEQPSKGFFGIGSKLAKVHVEEIPKVKGNEKKKENPYSSVVKPEKKLEKEVILCCPSITIVSSVVFDLRTIEPIK